MNLPFPEWSSMVGVCAALFPFFLLCARAPSQGDVDAEAVIARVDAARGKTPQTLVVEGTFKITFEGVPSAGSELDGKFREVFAGAKARHEGDLGELGKVELGANDEAVWEIDPMTGAKAHGGAQAAAIRRYFLLLRGVSARDLYASMVATGSLEIDGRAHVALKMTPKDGKPDTWYVDAEQSVVRRIDITLPSSEGTQAVWGFAPEIENRVTFGDWKRVGGAMMPHRRAVEVGPATFTYTASKVEVGVSLDDKTFAAPEGLRAAAKGAADAATMKEGFEVVERAAQPVASIRLKCKPADLTATLTVVFPEVIAHLNATGAKMTGAPFSRYHTWGADEIDVEAGLPVAKPITEKGRVKNSELPGGKVVTAWHVGDYQKLAGAHEALQAHVAANKWRPRGGPWEVYWTDPGMVPDPAKWRTQLFVVVE